VTVLRSMKLGQIFEQLGKLRDGFIVAASAIYLLGYLTWSTYAWRERLGPVAALDAQYFAAGLPIAGILVVALAGIVALNRFSTTRWRRFFESQSKSKQRVVEIALSALMLGFALLAARFMQKIPDNRDNRYRVVAATCFLAGAYVMVQLHGARRGKPSFFTRFAPSVVILLSAVSLIFLYGGTIYETIPDALGGGRPRLVTLDIRMDSVSNSTINQLLDHNYSGPPSAVMHTRPVLLLASQGDSYLFLVSECKDSLSCERIQLPKSAVQSIRWQ
jgi:hypothetical protein